MRGRELLRSIRRRSSPLSTRHGGGPVASRGGEARQSGGREAQRADDALRSRGFAPWLDATNLALRKRHCLAYVRCTLTDDCRSTGCPGTIAPLPNLLSHSCSLSLSLPPPPSPLPPPPTRLAHTRADADAVRVVCARPLRASRRGDSSQPSSLRLRTPPPGGDLAPSGRRSEAAQQDGRGQRGLRRGRLRRTVCPAGAGLRSRGGRVALFICFCCPYPYHLSPAR